MPERLLIDKTAFMLITKLVKGEITLDSVEAEELREYIMAKGRLMIRNAEYKVKHYGGGGE
jgi:hypothetical protein